MAIRCIVLDFDGTFTDVDREAVPFVESFPRLMADLVGAERLNGLWDRAIAEVKAQPHVYGWIFDGKVVAPGDADPYILATAAANRVFEALGLVRDSRLRGGVTQLLYQQAYQHTLPVFRAHAAEVMKDLLGRGLAVFVVSNSDSAAVRRKIETLGFPVLTPDAAPRAGHIQVFGDARKFAVEELLVGDPVFDALPVQADIGGPRQVFVRRGAYFRVLRDIWARSGTDAASTLVCGDIYELDLALPQALGCEVHLVSRGSTPEVERRFVGAGRTSDDLRALLKRLG
jgi:FMN phosphatase YigB (HAD superfamily)